MPPTTPGSANYYLALNGAPNGPHRAAEVLQLLQQGSIQHSVLICREGGAAWVPVAEMVTALRLEVTPAPPSPAPAPAYVSPPPPVPVAAPAASGYGGGSGGAPAPRYQPAPIAAPVSSVPSDGTRPLRFATLLGAVVLFFLPWLELRCAAIKSIKQSGVQTITSTYSVDESMFSMMELAGRSQGGPGFSKEQFAQMEGETAKKEFSSEVGYSWFAGGALLCVVIGLGAAFGSSGRQTCGVMALLALVCLGMQMLSGFPLKQQMDKAMKDASRRKGMTSQDAMAMQMILGDNKIVAVEFTPWFYGELGLLGLTAVIGFTGGNRRRT